MLNKLFGRNKAPASEEETETERTLVDSTLERADRKMGEARTLIREARTEIAEQEKERYARELRLHSGRGGNPKDDSK